MEKLAELRPMKVTDADGSDRAGPRDAGRPGGGRAGDGAGGGLADRLAALGIPCFGPTAKAAQLETSKAFSKDFCERHEYPDGRLRRL